MTRAQKSHDRDRIVQSFVDAFRKKLKADPGWDIGAAIEREKRAEYRGAMALAERQVYQEMREQNGIAMGDTYGGPIDRDGVELDEPEKGHCFEKYWNSKIGGES